MATDNICRQYPSFCLFHWILNYLHHLKLSQAHNLVYWFKNTRAALRRSHLRETAATRLAAFPKTKTRLACFPSWIFIKNKRRCRTGGNDQSIKLGCVHYNNRLLNFNCRSSIFLGANEDYVPEGVNGINNNSSNKNNNEDDRAKVVDETREDPLCSRTLGREGMAVDTPLAEAAVDLGLWAGQSSPSPTPSSLPNWQFSIHRLPHCLPNADSEVGRPKFSLPGPETRPRMRICFDPEHEIPKLQQWFQLNNHPSRLQVNRFGEPTDAAFQVEEYVAILNSLESRRGKKPLDVNNVIYWFKNTRAAVKRAQVGEFSPPCRYNFLNQYRFVFQEWS